MAFRSQRVLKTFLAGGDSRRPVAAQRRAIKITLRPQPGVRPSEKSPVRIYVGTESAQFRAERAFVWSIARVRDPARHYEIHLMKDFAGFERRLWLTGFTNYRFVIPELAGGEGRAIYNDTDQIYLKDPALLFDADMAGHGVLSINDHDTSVMLIDCEKMVSLWNGDTARNTRNRVLEERMRAVPGLWGEVSGIWNARDAEYQPGESAVVHYTTIHTQPWRPFPQDYVYQSNPATAVWLDIEAEADAAGYQLFDAQTPSPAFATACSDSVGTATSDFIPDCRRLLCDSHAQSMSYIGFSGQAFEGQQWSSGVPHDAVQVMYPDQLQDSALATQSEDVVVVDGIETLPDLDIPWLLDAAFKRARKAVHVSIDLSAGKLPYCPTDALWWYAQLVATSARYPSRHWRLVVRERRFPWRKVYRRWSGGRLLNTDPLTWAFMHYKTGHASQALGMAQTLGWAYEDIDIKHTMLRYWGAAVISRFPGKRAAMPGGITAPWPELIIASGWLPSLIARWVVRQNHGNTRLILMGRRGGPAGEAQHLAVHCKHFCLPPHPQHIETVLPPSKVNKNDLEAAAQRWPDLYPDGARPRIALLVGGTNAQCEFSADNAAKLGAQLSAATQQIDGSLAVLPSRRTGENACKALRANTGERAQFLAPPQTPEQENPYLGYLASADILVVTGDSESMLAEAVATGKPVYIHPLPARKPGVMQRVADWVYQQACTDRLNARGSRRPQEGLQYLCARLIEYRVLLPRRDLSALHERLVANNVARYLTDFLRTPSQHWTPSVWHEEQAVVDEIRKRLLGEGSRAAAVTIEPGHQVASA